MRSRVLVTRAVGFDHIPTEQWEYFIEACIPAEVGIVEIRKAAVAEADVGRYQGESRFLVLPNAIAVLVEERGRVDVGLPLVHGNIAHIHGVAASETDRCGESIHQHVVPLVKYGDAPIAIRKTRQREAAIAVALGKREVFAVRITEADVTLGEGKAA